MRTRAAERRYSKPRTTQLLPLLSADPALVRGLFLYELKRWQPNPWENVFHSARRTRRLMAVGIQVRGDVVLGDRKRNFELTLCDVLAAPNTPNAARHR